MFSVTAYSCQSSNLKFQNQNRIPATFLSNSGNAKSLLHQTFRRFECHVPASVVIAITAKAYVEGSGTAAIDTNP